MLYSIHLLAQFHFKFLSQTKESTAYTILPSGSVTLNRYTKVKG